MARKQQPVCEQCWHALRPGEVPPRQPDPPEEICAWCKMRTSFGAYIRSLDGQPPPATTPVRATAPVLSSDEESEVASPNTYSGCNFDDKYIWRFDHACIAVAAFKHTYCTASSSN